MQRTRTEPYIATYLHSKGRKLGMPIGGNFELTARCNFNCPMCYVHQNGPEVASRELTARQWIDLAQQARDQGMVFVLLTGGEPFVRGDFFEIYGAMKKMGLLISINSNGSMLSGQVLRRLLEDPPFRMNISLYGGCPETYQSMCGQDAFARVVENIRALRQAGVDVRINLSITPHNRQDMAKIHEIARELDTHIKATSYMFPSIRLGSGFGQCDRLSETEAAECSVAWDQLRFSPEQFRQRALALHQLKAVEVPDCPVESDAGVSCRAGSSSFWMTWDGRMLPCGMMPGPVAYPLEVGFQPAWEHILTETRKIRTPEQCTACPKREVCGVCAAACLTETGHFDRVPEFMCRMTDSLIEKTWEAYQKRKDDANADQERAYQA